MQKGILMEIENEKIKTDVLSMVGNILPILRSKDAVVGLNALFGIVIATYLSNGLSKKQWLEDAKTCWDHYEKQDLKIK